MSQAQFKMAYLFQKSQILYVPVCMHVVIALRQIITAVIR